MKSFKNRHLLQDVFQSNTEYQKYIKSAYHFLRGRKQSNLNHRIVPTYLEVRLSSKISNQRLFLDKKDHDTIVIELPVRKNTAPKKRITLRTQAFIIYSPILGIFEKALADEFAITEKLFDTN